MTIKNIGPKNRGPKKMGEIGEIGEVKRVPTPESKLRVRVKHAQQLARTGVLFAPVRFLKATLPTLMEVCDGCGASGAKFDFVPDRIYGTYIGYACFIHDFMYDEGHTIEDKEEADRVFLNNMLRLIERDRKWYKPTKLQRFRAKGYYRAVKYFGGPAYWKGK